MPIFGNMMSIQDAINRLPQFEHQINKLGAEEENTRNDQSMRKSFMRRSQDMHKQLDDFRKKTENIKTDDGYRKRTAIEQIDQLKSHLSQISPVREQTSSTIASSSQPSSRNSSEDSPDSKPPRPKPRQQQQQQQLQGTKSVGRMDAGEESDDEADSEHSETKDEPSSPETRPETVFEENENENEISEEVLVDGNTFVVLADLGASARGDLPIREGEVVQILETRDDGWWLARNENHEEGMVPKTYLRHVKERSKVARRLGTRDSVIAVPGPERPMNPMVRDVEGVASAITLWTGRKIECLGDAYRCDAHLTYSCHLAPRLSNSNIGFHDLYWNIQSDQVRKRHIRISRILRLVRLEGMPIIASKAIVRIALFDESRKRGRQIVSNVHTLLPRVKGTTWHFVNKEEQVKSCAEFADVIIRSNYAQKQVILVIEASITLPSTNGFEEKSLGVKRIGLLNNDGDVMLVSRTYVEQLREENLFANSSSSGQDTTRRVFFKVMDVPKEKVHFVDSMPDVLIFNAMYLKFFYFYRRRAGTILIRDNIHPMSSELVSDPLLAVFPNICDQHDVMDAMLQLWATKKKQVSKKSEVDQTIEFFQTFLHTAFFIHGTQVMPAYEIADDAALAARQKIIRTIVEALRKGQLRQLLSGQVCKPVNIFDYSLDLFGAHSID